jgi:hypothetical protein
MVWVFSTSSVWGLSVIGSSRDEDGTYVEDEKDLVEVRLPGRNHFLVILRVEKSRYCVPFVLLGDLPLDLRQHATAESIVSEVF